jgi:WD40 repeat protein
MRIWNAETGQTEATYPETSPRILYGVAWSFDSTYVIFGGDDCKILIGDLLGSKEFLARALPTNTGLGVRDIAFTPNGHYYLVSTDGQGAFLLQSGTNTLIHKYTINDVQGDISAIGWSPTEPEIAMGNSSNTLNIGVQLWKTIIE